MSPYTEALLVLDSTGTLELVCDGSTHYIIRVLLEPGEYFEHGLQPALALRT